MANGEKGLTKIVIKNAEGATVATAPSAVAFEIPWQPRPIGGILTAPADVLQPLARDYVYTVDYDAAGRRWSIQADYTNTFSDGSLQMRVVATGANAMLSASSSSTAEATAGEGQLTDLTIRDGDGKTVATSPAGLLIKVAGLAPIWMIVTGPADIIQPLIAAQYTIACKNDGHPASYQAYSQGPGSPQGLAFVLR